MFKWNNEKKKYVCQVDQCPHEGFGQGTSKDRWVSHLQKKHSLIPRVTKKRKAADTSQTLITMFAPEAKDEAIQARRVAMAFAMTGDPLL